MQIRDGVAIQAIEYTDETGARYGVSHVDNKPRVSAMPYAYDVAKGNVSGHTALLKFGRNAAVGATEETVWTPGGLYAYLAAAEQLKVSSDDADDDGAPAGAGARTMTIYGLDTNSAEIDETITLNGVGAVTTDASFSRVFRAQVRTAGASGGNEGTISVNDNADVVTLASIEPGLNQSLMALWTVPAGNTAHMVHIFANTSSTKASRVLFYVRPFGEVFQVRYHFEVYADSVDMHLELPKQIDAQSDIEVRAITGATGGAISAGFDLWYEVN